MPRKLLTASRGALSSKFGKEERADFHLAQIWIKKPLVTCCQKEIGIKIKGNWNKDQGVKSVLVMVVKNLK
ncbi:hypothetical protein MKL29_10770 [Streptococcus suis]|nr:hypothetical protein [Streptococcus suis]